MALDLKAVQVRLPEDAYDTLAMLASADDKDLGEVARELLVRALMGEGHALKVTVARQARAVASGKTR